MIVNEYFTQQHALLQEQQQALPQPHPQGAYQSRQWDNKEAAALTQQPQHRPTYTKASQPTAKARKAARRRASAGRKASR